MHIIPVVIDDIIIFYDESITTQNCGFSKEEIIAVNCKTQKKEVIENYMVFFLRMNVTQAFTAANFILSN